MSTSLLFTEGLFTEGMVSADVYARIQQFYARQMRLLDSGEAERWAATFTDDGVFEEDGKPEPLRGRSTIAASARARVDRLAGDDVRRRHWFGMLDAEQLSDGTLRTSFYALAMATPRGGALDVYVSSTCVDELVDDGSTFLVRHRKVSLDAA